MKGLKLVIAVLGLCIYYQSNGATLPTGFTESRIAQELNPTSMALAPDGRLFLAMKDGRVLVIRDDVLQEDPFLTVAVDNFNERGLSGIAFHPDFETNQLIYVYYTVPGENHNRISTFQGNGDFAIPGSEIILLDLDPMAGTIHNGGAMKFGPDGKLYVAVGDGADSGTAQDMAALLGKFLRLNPDGSIPPDNPFYNTQTGNSRAIYALGFRNPFTFDIQPETGRIFSNDVGGGDFEEVNEVLAGMNYGWPIIEGNLTTEVPPANYQDPVYAYSHDLGCSIIGAAFYPQSGGAFPEFYAGKYFFGDYCEGYLKVLDPDTGVILETFAEAINRPIAMVVNDQGDMYYLERAGMGGGSMQDNTSTDDGNLWKIIYTGSGAPLVTLQPESQLVAIGEEAYFSVNVSGTIPFNYQWQKDQVDISGANESFYIFSDAQLVDDGSLFRCVISNNEGSVTSQEALLQVTSNSRPLPLITQPNSTFLYQAGQTITFAGQATDPEDGNLDASALTWWIDFHHDEHTHPGLSAQSGIDNGQYMVPRVGETSDNVWYRVYLQATDSEGLSQVVYLDVFPLKSTTHLITDPPGLSLSVDGKITATPATITGVVGVTRTLEAPHVQEDQVNFYVFDEWNDGSQARFFSFDTPVEGDTLLARYQSAPLGLGDGLLGRYWSDQDQTFDGAATLTRIDSQINFDWGGGSPHSSVSDDFFTARWMGFIQPLFDAEYTFYTVSDDGVRLWINNQLIIDKWIPQPPTEWSGTITLQAGETYELLLEYYEQAGGAVMELWWSNPVTGKQLIPSTQLLRPDLVLAVPEKSHQQQLQVFPIPADEELHIRYQTNLPEDISLIVYNLNGQRVWYSESSSPNTLLEWRIDLEDWPSGIYSLRAVSNTDTKVRRFVKP